MAKFVDFTHGQINELVSDYGKVDILWLDGGWVRKTSDDEVKNIWLMKLKDPGGRAILKIRISIWVR